MTTILFVNIKKKKKVLSTCITLGMSERGDC